MSPDDRELVRQMIANAIGYRIYAKSSADGHGDAVEARALAADDPSAQSEVRRMETWGVRSVPPKGTEACVVFVNGGASNGIVVGSGSDRYGPLDLKDGEAAIYCKESGTVLKFDEDGNIVGATAGGATIRVNRDGSAKVTAASGQSAILETSGTGVAQITASPLTGTVKLGPVGSLAVLVQGSIDSNGVPVTQAPAASATIVKAG